jgi:UDP-N-acetylglucosamine 2-epimerase (non-hydrolysing)/GDP/UDP-N,N'-diacetylbacillosamine 2-epimerase (hydrolysing)
MKRIGVVTGTRAEYGYLRPLLDAIIKEPTLELRLYVSGMHLLKEYGDSIREIKRDGFKITRTIDMGSKAMANEYELAQSIGKGVIGFSNVLMEDHPDITIVFGDRTEPFAAAIASTSMNIPVAHIAGGEVGMGDIDHVMRHAITKLSHLHFVQTEESEQRLLKLGEEDWRIHNVGALTLDTILSTDLRTREDLSNEYNIKLGKFILIAYHPVSTEWEGAKDQIGLVLDSVVEVATESNYQIVIIYPNDYPGGTRIIEVTESYSDRTFIHVFKNLPHIDYISLIKLCNVYVGNSSSGLIEAPSLGVPYVCIGTRQKERERAHNVIDVGYDKKEITSAIRKSLNDAEFLNVVAMCESPYGDGNASQRIIEELKHINIDVGLLNKKMTY